MGTLRREESRGLPETERAPGTSRATSHAWPDTGRRRGMDLGPDAKAPQSKQASVAAREKGRTRSSDHLRSVRAVPCGRSHQCGWPSTSPGHSPAAGAQTAIRRHQRDRPMLPRASHGRQAGLSSAPSVFPGARCEASLCNREETCPAAGPGQASSLRAGRSHLRPGGRPGLTLHLP